MNILEKLTNWYFSRDSLPYWCIMVIDSLCVLFSYFYVYYLFYNFGDIFANIYPLTRTFLLYTLISCIGLKIYKTYSDIIRYSSFVDLRKVALANFMSVVLVIIIHYIINTIPIHGMAYIGVRHIVAVYTVATLFMWGIRVIVKEVYDLTFLNTKAKRTVIYGIPEGMILVKTIRVQKPKRFQLKGFIANHEGFRHKTLSGEKVFYINEQLPELLMRNGIEAVLVAPALNEEFRNNQELQDMLIEVGIKIYMMPDIVEIKETGGVESAQHFMAREVSMEDLLPREKIELDMAKVESQLKGKRILITGSAGSIGSEIVRQVAQFKPAAMMLIDQAETPQHDIRLMMAKEWPDIKAETVVTSITKRRRMEDIFRQFKPEYVFHAAAYKHVPMMENNPCESIQNNIAGTDNLADLSVKYGVEKFVMVSTDKAVNPTNVMGCSKRICEIYVQALDKAIKDGKVEGKTQFITTRFGNVLGSNGSVIPLFKKQILNGGPVTVTDPDIIRFFMLIPEACKLVLEAGTMGKGGEIFVFDMGKPVKIVDLARRMIKLYGAKNVEIEYTGLRDGEKLYEEVLDDQEFTKPTFNKKIRIAAVREYDYEKVKGQIAELVETSYEYDAMKTVGMMKDLVPEFKSQHSVYEKLDTAQTETK